MSPGTYAFSYSRRFARGRRCDTLTGENSMIKRLFGLLVLPLFLTGCSFSSPPSTSDEAPVSGEVEIRMKNLSFQPRDLVVLEGTKITWTNMDSVAHDVVSDTNAWAASPLLNKGESFSVTLLSEGTYSYDCTPHSFMTGTIIVKKAE